MCRVFIVQITGYFIFFMDMKCSIPQCPPRPYANIIENYVRSITDVYKNESAVPQLKLFSPSFHVHLFVCLGHVIRCELCTVSNRQLTMDTDCKQAIFSKLRIFTSLSQASGQMIGLVDNCFIFSKDILSLYLKAIDAAYG